ncbi:hypothetical protein, partial [Bacillus altitudinis]|uniref:hypothetical protein n=1 Tax=Bacillus altitudinis TaxID=293387 RepID=UPI0016436F8E
KIVDANGKEIKRGVVRDEKGKMMVKNLKGGSYEFVERKGGLGDEVEERAVSFGIASKAEKVVSVRKENRRRSGGVVLQKRGEDGK